MENEHATTPAAPATTPRRRKGWIVAGVVAAVVAGGAGLAVATDYGPRHHMGHGGPGMMHGGFGGRFMERGVERALDGIEATDEQKKKIWAIIDRTRADLMPVGREMRTMRDDVLDLLASPTIDRAKAETLRTERLATLDAATRKVTDSLLEAAEVLTPEQRARIAEHIKERGERRW